MNTTQKTEQPPFAEWVGYEQAELMFGLTRTHLWKLGKAGQVQTVAICEPGKTRGRRLYSVESIRALFTAAIKEAK